MAQVGGPRWEEIAEDLARRIRAGEFPVGAPLPSTSRLMAHHGARSDGPVKKAVNALRAAGVVQGRPGSAVYVTRVPGPDEALTDSRSLADRVLDLERRQGETEAHLIELYGRLGQPYPGTDQAPEHPARRRRSS